MKKKVGFMGLGIMGRPMAENILHAGWPLCVFNRSRERTSILAALGAQVAASPYELAQDSDIVVCMVTGPEAVYALLTGETGCARGLKEGTVFVNMSTVSPAYAKEFAAGLLPLGVQYVDAPVSGSQRPAEEGSLVILAGGQKELVTDLEPLFLAMGKKVVHCGDVGMGAMAKMSANMLLGGMMGALAETLCFARQGGLTDDTLFDLLAGGPMACDLFAMKEEMLRNGRYPAQFPLRHMAKDLKFVLDTAYATGAHTPTASVMLQLYRSALAQGWGDVDFSAIAKLLAELGGKLGA